jgi:hypothetical protein
MARHRSKSDLPTKVCPVCDRPFAWRKKWADCWEEIKYCSERCRRRRVLITLDNLTSFQEPLYADSALINRISTEHSKGNRSAGTTGQS